jgi:type II secretory pathway component PulJ
MNKKSRGFTIVEAMVAMGLLAAFLVVLMTLFISIVNVQTKSAGNSAVMQDGKFLMARLNYDITRATAISTPNALGASTSTLVMTIAGNTYTYVLNGVNLQLTDGLGTANLNGNRTTISNLNFQKLGNVSGKESIRYTFTVTSAIKETGPNDTQTYTSTVERR